LSAFLSWVLKLSGLEFSHVGKKVKVLLKLTCLGLVFRTPITCVKIQKILRPTLSHSGFRRYSYDIISIRTSQLGDLATSLQEVHAHYAIFFVGFFGRVWQQKKYIAGLTSR
jgi:hypothetical protein